MTYRMPSSSFTCSWTYSVFLSFRGTDTRKGFTGYLYKALCDKGIETFIDDEELQKGESITPALIKAIEESRMAIIIFSENYASSRFCLEELVKILELMGQKHRLVWPVFYKVDPSDVRHQKGIFGEAFNKLIEERFNNNTDKVKKWKSALEVAADLSGWHFCEGYEYEYQFINRIIDEVSKKTMRIPLHVAKYPVGLESRVQKVKALLETTFKGRVNMVGIYGIGGIGKTTIASAVYNLIADNFEGACFLNDIRENSYTKHDMVQLQKKLLVDILRDKDIKLGSVKEGSAIIKHRLQKKKVLLILDDVDRLEQLQILAGGLDWFGFGSKIIVTTRDKHLLDAHCVERQYEEMGLTDIEALELFSWNAFKKENVDPSYMDMSKDLVSYSSGLPLALEVIGSNLCARRRDAWESALCEYRRTVNKSIYEILKVSYDCLEEYQQTIFLDLACFFRGAHLIFVTNILVHGRNLDPRCGIEELVDKSLIRIDRGNHVEMHDLIQVMGREIVRQESPSRPGKRSRLWSFEDIIHILEGNMGSENIEVMMVKLPGHQTVHWDGYAFKKMKNLQVLIIKSAKFSTKIKHLPTCLRLFEWKGYPFSGLPSNFFPKNLVMLELSNSCFILDRSLKNFESLKYLNLSDNKILTEVPDISKAPNLVDLRFQGCSNLIKVHNSVGIHSKIRNLDFRGCTKLSIFPRHITLKSLEYLNFSNCSSLKIFPEILEKMENITQVTLNDSGIEKLPFSVQNLVGLRELLLARRRYKSSLGLPCSILTLPELRNFYVACGYESSRSGKVYFYHNGEEREEKQDRIYPFVRTRKKGNFYRCNFTGDFLPEQLPCLPQWDELCLDSCDLTILPTCIKKFPFLEKLKLRYCHQLKEIRGLPLSLKKLILYGCEQLEKIREFPPKIKKVIARNCKLLTSESSSILLSEKFYEDRGKFIILPGAKIPEWFQYCSKGPSLSFWFRKKIPSIILCAIVNAPWKMCKIIANLLVNGFQEIRCIYSMEMIPYKPLMTEHILVFDLKAKIEPSVAGLIIKHGWNHVEISLSDFCHDGQESTKWIGVYVCREETNMEDISFMRPIPFLKRKFDDFEVQNDPYMKYHHKEDILPTWYHDDVPILLEAIFNMQAPTKVKILFWKICQHQLETHQSLFESEDVESPLCPVCGVEEENLEHAFLLCPWTRPIWFGCEFQWIVDSNSLECFEVWLSERLRIIKREHTNFNQAAALLACICWAIWNARTDFKLQGQPLNPECVLNRAVTMHKEYSDPSMVQ